MMPSPSPEARVDWELIRVLLSALVKIKDKTKVWQSDGHVCEARVDNDACYQIARNALDIYFDNRKNSAAFEKGRESK